MKSLFRPTLLAAAVAGVLLSSTTFAQTKLESEKDKISYVIGTQIGGSLAPIKDEVDLAIVIEALKNSVDGKEPALSPEQAMEVQKAFAQKMQAKQAAKMQEMATQNKADGEAFLAKNKSADGVKSTESGLQYKVVSEGSGQKPAATDTV